MGDTKHSHDWRETGRHTDYGRGGRPTTTVYYTCSGCGITRKETV